MSKVRPSVLMVVVPLRGHGRRIIAPPVGPLWSRVVSREHGGRGHEKPGAPCGTPGDSIVRRASAGYSSGDGVADLLGGALTGAALEVVGDGALDPRRGLRVPEVVEQHGGGQDGGGGVGLG